jgi:hypothetical protein
MTQRKGSGHNALQLRSECTKELAMYLTLIQDSKEPVLIRETETSRRKSSAGKKLMALT